MLFFPDLPIFTTKQTEIAEIPHPNSLPGLLDTVFLYAHLTIDGV